MNWYMNIYYNFKGYPIVGDSSTDKPNELRSLYSNMLKQYLKCFEIKTDLDSAYNNNENNQSTILL